MADIQTPLGPTVAGASPELLVELLGEFEALAIGAGMPADAFRPGLPAGEVEDRLTALGVKPESEVVAWFSWRDGHRDGLWATPRFPLAPLSYVEQAYSWGERGSDEWQWPPAWLSLGATAHGMVSGPSIDGLVRVRPISPEVSLQGDTNPKQVVSLCTPVSWWIDALNSGAWVWRGTYWEESTERRVPAERADTWLV